MVWKDLALDILLPVDPVKEEAARAAKARRLANGTQGADADADGEGQRVSDSDTGFEGDETGQDIGEMEPELPEGAPPIEENEEDDEQDDDEGEMYEIEEIEEDEDED